MLETTLKLVEDEFNKYTAGVYFTFGAETLSENLPAPRIIWIATSDKFVPGTQVDDGRGTIFNCKAGVAACIFAATHSQTRAYCHNLIKALKDTLGAGVVTESCSWDQSASLRFDAYVQNSHLASCRYCVIPVSIDLRMVDEVLPIPPVGEGFALAAAPDSVTIVEDDPASGEADFGFIITLDE